MSGENAADQQRESSLAPIVLHALCSDRDFVVRLAGHVAAELHSKQHTQHRGRGTRNTQQMQRRDSRAS